MIVLLPVRTTGKGNVSGLAPETVIFAPILIWLALVNIRFVNGVNPPTAPEKETAPEDPAFNVNAVAPFNVLEKLMLAPVAAPEVVSNARGVANSTTGLFIAIAPPAVVILP